MTENCLILNQSKISLTIVLSITIILSKIQISDGYCRYRDINKNFPKEIFKYFSSWGCYIYTRPDFFVTEPLKVIGCTMRANNMLYTIPGLIDSNDNLTCHGIHYTNDYIVTAVSRTFATNRTLHRWIECSKDGERCCDKMSDDISLIANKDNRCPTVWDGWSCFDQTTAGIIREKLCSKYAYGSMAPKCAHFSYKQCFKNGTWNAHTDYSTCDITPRIIFRTKLQVGIIGFSIIIALPGLLIILIKKSLRMQRFQIIASLLLALCVHGLIVISVKIIIILNEMTTVGETVMGRNSVACRSLTFIEKLSGNAVYICVLLIGIYLHQFLTRVLQVRQSGGPNMIPFYISGFLLVVGSAIIWAIVIKTISDNNCWQVTEGTNISWILDGVRLSVLIINTILLIHLIWSLWHTFKQKDSNKHPVFRTFKAALICTPTFGIPYLFITVRPSISNCDLEQLYYILIYLVDASQIIFIVSFHCYTEKEVQSVFKAVWEFLIYSKENRIKRKSTVTKQEMLELSSD